MDAAKYISIFELNPSDDFVSKREAAIRDLSTQYTKTKSVADIAKISEAVISVFATGAVADENERNRIAAAIKKQSSSFVADDRELEIGICGLLALAITVDVTGKVSERLGIADVYAMSIWSALSFIGPVEAVKMNDLRNELIDVSRRKISRSSLDIRQRRDVPAFKPIGDAPLDDAKFVASTRTTVDALRFNAALDREEIDILWWALGDASTTLKQPLSKLSPYVAAVCAGYEVGQLMRTLPSDSHRNLVANKFPETDPLSLVELLEKIEGDRPALAKVIATEDLITTAPLTFPALTALSRGQAEGSASEIKRPLQEWAARILLETAITRLQYEASGRL